MGSSKIFLFLTLAFAVVLLLSNDVIARELAESAETQPQASLYGHGHGHYGGGHYGGGGGHGHYGGGGGGHGHGGVGHGHGGGGHGAVDETENGN